MGNGLFQGPRTVVYSSGTRTVQLCSVCFKGTRIPVGDLKVEHVDGSEMLPSHIDRPQSWQQYFGHWEWGLAGADMYVSRQTFSPYHQTFNLVPSGSYHTS